MSLTSVHNFGRHRVRDLFDMLNRGVSAKDCAKVFHISESTMSRIIKELFRWKPEPLPQTLKIMYDEANVKEFQARDLRQCAEEMKGNVIPFRQTGIDRRA